MPEAPAQARSAASGSASPAMDELNAAPEPTDTAHSSADAMIADRGAAPEGYAREPDDVAIAGRPRDQHEAQADGIPDATPAGKTDRERLTPAPDGPGEFTGDESVPPADNTEIDGRISGVPPSYDNPNDEVTDSPAHDAEVQSEQPGNAGEDD